MKILVPIDFSEISNYAIDAAKKLALRLNAQVDFFHCVTTKDMLSVYIENREVNEIYQQQVNDFVVKKLEGYSNEFKKAGIQANYMNSHGDFLPRLKELNKAFDYDLIIMGSHGQSGIVEWAMGSNAQKVVRKIETNVLVVKNEVDKIDFSEVVFVTGLDKSDQEPFRKFLQFVQNLNVDMLHILAVDTAFYFTQPRFIMQEALQDFKNIANKYNVKTHFYSDYSIEAGVRHFVEDKGISLVGISNHGNHPIQRIFRGSNVEAIVNQSVVPVLSINY